MRVIFLISGVVLLVTCIIFFIYEFYTFRNTTIEKLSTIGKIISTNSTAALAFENAEDAKEILAALKAEPHVIAASLYDKDGNIFSQYSLSSGITIFPDKPQAEGYNLSYSHLEMFQAVKQEDRELGTLYLKSDLGAMYDGFKLYGITTALVIGISFLLAYVLSKNLQKSISQPILALADAAKVVSTQNDYSVRVAKQGTDELGSLTDAFNHMLIQIQEQNKNLNEFNQKLEQKVVARTAELEKSTKLFSDLFNYNPASIVISRLDDAKIINVNDAFISSFGFTGKEEVLGKTARELNLVSKPEQREELTTLLQKKKVVKDFEIESFTQEGKSFWISTSILIIELDDVPCLFSISIDISNRKKAEEELQAINKELDSFSYSVSHDLRAPLRAIHSYTKILEEDHIAQLDEDAQKTLNIILRNSKKMGELIDDLLAFSRLGRKEIAASDINMNSLARTISEDYISSPDINITIKSLLPAKGDSTLIKQVWINLISNAVKYSRKSKKNEKSIIQVGCMETDNNNVYYVKDNGVGFSMDYYSKLFGVFQRLHSQDEFEGTGVGLAIVKRIVDRHKGEVWADSKLNEGSTFYFSLPKIN